MRTINMSRDMPCYLISDPELDQLTNPDRLAIVGQVSTVVIGAAVSAAVSFGIANNWWAGGASLAFGLFAGWVAWKHRPPKNQHEELIRTIKEDSYDRQKSDPEPELTRAEAIERALLTRRRHGVS